MKKIIASLTVALVSTCAMAEVNFQVIPLPQSVVLDASGKTTLMIKGQAVSYPADNARMKRNAEFAEEFLGLKPQAELATKGRKKAKDITPVRLTLGLTSDNPDAYQITVDKKGVLIQGASESGVFYAIQTLRKSIAQEQGDTITLRGRGWGHGVGLCQIGAAVMATKGFNYKQILEYYYKGATIE